MSLFLQQGEVFTGDFEHQARWYVRHADEQIARRYLEHLRETLRLLTIHPAMGRVRRYRHPELKGLRSFRVNPPFQRHLIFYRYDASTLYAVRVIDGARDLPRRLLEPTGAD